MCKLAVTRVLRSPIPGIAKHDHKRTEPFINGLWKKVSPDGGRIIYRFHFKAFQNINDFLRE